LITMSSSGSFKHTEAFLKAMKTLHNQIMLMLDSAGKLGVTALSLATPVRTGLVASSWSYKVGAKDGKYSVVWMNTDIENGFPVAIMLQYGYATGTGGFVQGQDYINPAIRPIFDKIADRVWKVVTSA